MHWGLTPFRLFDISAVSKLASQALTTQEPPVRPLASDMPKGGMNGWRCRQLPKSHRTKVPLRHALRQQCALPLLLFPASVAPYIYSAYAHTGLREPVRDTFSFQENRHHQTLMQTSNPILHQPSSPRISPLSALRLPAHEDQRYRPMAFQVHRRPATTFRHNRQTDTSHERPHHHEPQHAIRTNGSRQDHQLYRPRMGCSPHKPVAHSCL